MPSAYLTICEVKKNYAASLQQKHLLSSIETCQNFIHVPVRSGEPPMNHRNLGAKSLITEAVQPGSGGSSFQVKPKTKKGHVEHQSWLVVFRHPSETYEFVNWDDEIPNIWENKNMAAKPPTRKSLGGPSVF